MDDPIWLVEAMKHQGTKEIKGSKHEPKILEWWKAIRRGGIKDDETPWCAAFVGGCLEAVGLRSSRYESALSYMEWGVEINTPVVGCIAVIYREGGGHVGFVVGKDGMGNIQLLAGNQRDEINIRAFPPKRVLSYRWPAPVPLSTTKPLPLRAGVELSYKEV
jgi:uncharacterized protein (TIGR02594 family)